MCSRLGDIECGGCWWTEVCVPDLVILNVVAVGGLRCVLIALMFVFFEFR